MAPQVYLTLTPSRSERRSYYKQILLSSWLLIFGVTLIVAGFVLLVKDEKESHWGGCFGLGGLLFVPGAYHTRIVYLSFRKKQGYSFSHLSRF